MLSLDFIRKAGNAWRSAACELQNLANLHAAHDEATRYRDLYSLTRAIKSDGYGQ